MLQKIKAQRGRIFLFLILLLTAMLTLSKLSYQGLGNQYYTAAVKSMLSSWHNFFFVSFDKGGFITVDKPPLGLWLQCLSALIFGVHGWSVILPEALCSIASVAVLYHIVKKSWGELTALLAALFMALTPIFIAVSRTNNVDPALVLVCLLALWALMTAAEKGSLKGLILSMALIGIGFNIKMLQAYMFLPAIYLVYYYSGETKKSKRAHLLIATAALAVISLSWCAAVDLTPAADRPYVGSSDSNSELDLALGYNGILRILPAQQMSFQSMDQAITFVPNEGANAGLFRFFNAEMAGQASWLLPLAVFGIIALLIRRYREDKTDHTFVTRQLLLWGSLFVPMFIYFSISGHVHRYYLIMFAPCLAALAAIAVTEYFKYFKCGWDTEENIWHNVMLPLSLIVTAGVQVFVLLAYYGQFAGVLVPVIAAATLAAVGLFIAAKYLTKYLKVITGFALALALVGLLAAPAYWTLVSIHDTANVITPFGGPREVSSPTNNGIRIKTDDKLSWNNKWSTGGDMNGDLIPLNMLNYMMAHDNGSRFLFAVPSAMYAASTMLDNDVSIMPLGGFFGFDNPITTDQFAQLVQKGELQYFPVFQMQDVKIAAWVKAHGSLVDSSAYTTKPQSPMTSAALYDLSGLKMQ